MSRELTEKWHEGWIEAKCYADADDTDGEPVSLPIICQHLAAVIGGDCADNEWFPAHAAPDRAFEPAEPDALEVGERVWAHDPDKGTLGYVRVFAFAEDPLFVWVSAVGKKSCVLRAACHRVGPQSEPPDPEALFLGRRGALDFWWVDGCVMPVGADSADSEEADEEAVWINIRAAAALTVARELGLVDAEADEPAPEPERAEPKFQMGQWVDLGGLKFCIGGRVWHPVKQYWGYSGHTATGSWTTAYERNLEPCGPILTAEQDALRRGDVVEIIEIPVGSDGVPFSEPAPLAGPETIEYVTFRYPGHHWAGLAHGPGARLHNLRLVKKAEPEEERAPS